MPISKAAKKAQRQNMGRRVHNLNLKKTLKETIKSAKTENLDQVFSVIDKAAKRHLIHKNKAARLKSNLVKQAGQTKKQTTKTKTKRKRTKKK